MRGWSESVSPLRSIVRSRRPFRLGRRTGRLLRPRFARPKRPDPPDGRDRIEDLGPPENLKLRGDKLGIVLELLEPIEIRLEPRLRIFLRVIQNPHGTAPSRVANRLQNLRIQIPLPEHQDLFPRLVAAARHAI